MEYIPLNTPSSHKKNVNFVGSNDRKQRRNLNPTPRSSYVGCDNKLIPRIKEYLQTSKGKVVSVTEMVEALQRKYSDYGRKKRNALKIAVMKAYDTIRQEKAFIGNGSSTKESSSDSSDLESEDADLGSDFLIDNEKYGIYKNSNSANDSLRKLYSKNLANTPRQNISSNPVTSTPSVVEPPSIPSGSASVPQNMLTMSENIIQCQKGNSVTETPANNASLVVKKRKSVTEDGVTQKKKGKASKEIVLQRSSYKFSDIGGNEEVKKEVCKLLIHLKHPEVFKQMGVSPPRGVLLTGLPGCGKTLLAHAIAGEINLPFIKMAATELVSGISGESEEKIRDLFEKAVTAAPCIVFIDEIDAICPKRETAQREMERRIVAQLLTCLDDLNTKDIFTQVLVIGATNRPDAIDSALRRAGRFDREIEICPPNGPDKIRILEVLCQKMKLSDVDFSVIASLTPGFVGADFNTLTREAGMHAAIRVVNSLQEKLGVDDDPEPSLSTLLSWLNDTPPLTEEQSRNLCVEMKDFLFAADGVKSSSTREGFITVPDATWDDVGAYHDLREELHLSIMAPIQHPETLEELGLSTPAGILLYGPPGCGKTLLAKAIANEAGLNFISVKGPELLNMYVGESERGVRQCFQRARNSAPCVIFFDELDALCPKRTNAMEANVMSRLVNTLLTELDGIQKRKNVFVLGATNRLDIIDPAIMRPGRLDKILFVGLPSEKDRFEILNTLTKRGTRPRLDPDVSLVEIAKDPRCNGFTGADLAALVKTASERVLQELVSNNKVSPTCFNVVKKKHFEEAFRRVHLSVSPKELLKYERMKANFTNSNHADMKPVVPMEIGEAVNTEIMDITEPDVS